jgi:Transposase DDE domain
LNRPIIQNHTVLRQCLAWVNSHYRTLFTDHRTKKLYTGRAILLFLEATLRQRKCVDHIADNFKTQRWLQKWLQLDSISSSALYTKLEELPLELLQEMFQQIVQAISRYYAGKMGLSTIGNVYAVDSTEIRLPPVHGAWAYATAKKNAVRMHTCLLVADDESSCPQRIVLATGDVHEQEVLSDLVTDSKATYVFDRGYVNYGRYGDWTHTDIPFVARIKHNNKCHILEQRPVKVDSNIKLDAEVLVKKETTKETIQLRLVEYYYVDRKQKRKLIRVLTNRRDLSAEQISEIYRARWKVELFFKWLKQHAKLEKLYSRKPSAVWNQLYLSLIAYGLCEWIRLTMKPEYNCWEILSRIHTYGDFADGTLLQALEHRPARKKKEKQHRKERGDPTHTTSKLKGQRIIIR